MGSAMNVSVPGMNESEHGSIDMIRDTQKSERKGLEILMSPKESMDPQSEPPSVKTRHVRNTQRSSQIGRQEENLAVPDAAENQS